MQGIPESTGGEPLAHQKRAWPSGLQSLTFGDYFNQRMDIALLAQRMLALLPLTQPLSEWSKDHLFMPSNRLVHFHIPTDYTLQHQ